MCLEDFLSFFVVLLTLLFFVKLLTYSIKAKGRQQRVKIQGKSFLMWAVFPLKLCYPSSVGLSLLNISFNDETRLN